MDLAEIRQTLIINQQQGTLVELYNFNDDDMFDVGFVIAVDELFVLLLGLDWDGKINGLTAIRLASIHQVRDQTDYLLTVSTKAKVAQEHGYFDVWHLQDYLHDHSFKQVNILRTLLEEAYQNHQAVVLGTDQYKGMDDFQGFITELSTINLTLHYYNSHDLSSLWEYDILVAKVDYLRVHGYQAAQTSAIFEQVFHEGGTS